jgi:DNA-binding response OmpR family regulator
LYIPNSTDVYYNILSEENILKGVLIVDDDESVRRTLKDYLSLYGIPVLGVGRDGYEAIDLFEKLQPDVVLLDITMPNLDGFGALETIQRKNENAKVIMLTAHAESDYKFAAKTLKSCVYITKPYEMQDVVDTIHKMLAISAA